MLEEPTDIIIYSKVGSNWTPEGLFENIEDLSELSTRKSRSFDYLPFKGKPAFKVTSEGNIMMASEDDYPEYTYLLRGITPRRRDEYERFCSKNSDGTLSISDINKFTYCLGAFLK